MRKRREPGKTYHTSDVAGGTDLTWSHFNYTGWHSLVTHMLFWCSRPLPQLPLRSVYPQWYCSAHRSLEGWGNRCDISHMYCSRVSPSLGSDLITLTAFSNRSLIGRDFVGLLEVSCSVVPSAITAQRTYPTQIRSALSCARRDGCKG